LAGIYPTSSPQTKISAFTRRLDSLQKHVDEALKLFSLENPSACAPALLAGRAETEVLIKDVEQSSFSPADKAAMLTSLRTKLEPFQEAGNEALGIVFEVSVDQPGPPPAQSYFPRMEQTMSLAAPGQTFTVTMRLYNRGKSAVTPGEIRVEVPEGWTGERV